MQKYSIVGMAFDTLKNALIVAHSLHGIYEVDLSNGEQKQLVSNDDIIGSSVRNNFIIMYRINKN
jgi:hypothetical protein